MLIKLFGTQCSLWFAKSLKKKDTCPAYRPYHLCRGLPWAWKRSSSLSAGRGGGHAPRKTSRRDVMARDRLFPVPVGSWLTAKLLIAMVTGLYIILFPHRRERNVNCGMVTRKVCGWLSWLPLSPFQASLAFGLFASCLRANIQEGCWLANDLMETLGW